MKLSKRLLWVVIMILLFPGLIPSAEAQSSKNIRIILDGVQLTSDTAPYVIPKLNITMVPLRVISEGLGAVVTWKQSTKTAIIENTSNFIQLTNGKTTGLVNGATVSLDASVQSRNGRIMVPLRFVGEALGLQVNWNQADQSITLIRDVVRPDLGSDGGNGNNGSLRGSWVSTVYNLDWPSSTSYGDIEKQKEEYIKLIDNLQAIGLNSIFVQIRPAGDALYSSMLVPWSKTLTGTQGMDPGYDPLQFMIDETHARDMEFHAWFNPFRANTDLNTSTLASNHIAIEHPEWVLNTKSQLIINPGIPEARAHVIEVIMEVVNKYNIDGVHLDDYFYPTGGTIDDDSTYVTYNSNHIATKANWRRDNINQFIQQLNQSIHSVKPQLSFGVSPFGVWRNDATDRTGSDTKASITSYDNYYADVRTWIQNSWVDYVVPQLYWSLSNANVRYDTLVNWWVNEVEGTDVELYIGHAPYKLGTTEIGWQNAQEIINQLKYNAKQPEVKGSIFFSARHLLNNPLELLPALTTYYHQ
ncbi:family 10 glycosylhydrolase [Paenibacillus crassostreae]|uniref:Glycosyl hydrolase-like 10 domain-containing protein n=1 Tax=Paenibacillus crassostreae TaxID=1763538 RepID=A0A167DH69_9BACL|nr:family 10 glycosylhydrolase [Paenibacillus crassostreae]AOZ91477.1 hypothetical protein LPB68_04140 [Paenibacillus crassostreae]OAB74364.1 hypothetical protein PNBC_09820 [Paenibacillus crassostreae]